MRLKLFKKYFFITVSIVAAIIVVLMMILSVVLNNHITKTSYSTLEECCNQIDESYENITDNESFLKVACPLSQVAGADIFITDAFGTVLTCACDEWQENGKCMHSSYIVPKEIIDKTADGVKSEINNLGIYKNPHYVAIKAIGEEKRLFVFSTMPIDEARGLLHRISRIYYLWAIIPLIILLVAIYFVTYTLTKPIKSMSEAAKAMAKGDFSKRVPVTTDDEIGELAASFNMMTNSLSRLESTRKSFVANVSHELKTPMTTIGGFIDGILDGTIKPEQHEYYLKIVSSEVQRLSRLVNNMLSIAKMEANGFELKAEKFDFYELLCTIIIGQERRVEERELNIIGLDTLKSVKVYWDKDLIHQVLYNLVDNAIKFTDKGGDITFSLSDDNEKVRFTITNTGKGIAQSELPFVFERFYKTDKSRSDVKDSTGLGLYIAKMIISAHKGKILVKSKENEFTAFKIILPKEI